MRVSMLLICGLEAGIVVPLPGFAGNNGGTVGKSFPFTGLRHPQSHPDPCGNIPEPGQVSTTLICNCTFYGSLCRGRGYVSSCPV